MRRTFGVCIAAAMVVAACGDDETGPNISGVPTYSIQSVQVTPAVETLYVTDSIRPTRQYSAVALSRGGATIGGMRFAWTTTDSGIATVDTLGKVTPQSVGLVEVLASAGKVGRGALAILPATATTEISPLIDTLFVDDPIVFARDTLRFRATARDARGQPLAGIAFTWISTTGNAAVEESGLVHATSLGTTNIRVIAQEIPATATLHVLPVVKNVTLTAPTLQVLDGDTLQLTATAFDYLDKPMARSFTYATSSTIAQVNASGRVIFSGTGTVTITARTAFRTSNVTVESFPRQLLAVDAGNDFACGVTALGRGYCWGVEGDGVLGSAADSTCFEGLAGTGGCTLAPKRTEGPAEGFSQVSAGGSFACGVSTAQRLYCWGNDDFGQIGNGAGGSTPTPSLATVKTERFTVVTAGGDHACGLNLVGTAYCWGNDSHGQLGDRRRINSTTPIPVADTTLSFIRIAAGERHTCAITADGRAYCWGDGAQGQLGNGGVAVMETPTLVAGGLAFIDITAGGTHTCGIVQGGAAYCWGDNSDGQLGVGVVDASRLVPTLVVGGGGYTAISAGTDHTCGIANGTVRCWGEGEDGRVGDGSIDSHNVSTPTVVSGGFAATAITAGARHTCAIGSDNLTWCWGSNRFGALGNEYQAAVRATPQLVARPR